MINPHKIRGFMVVALFISLAVHFIFVYFLLISKKTLLQLNNIRTASLAIPVQVDVN